MPGYRSHRSYFRYFRPARAHEGKLQVELAQLRHMATRLVRGWTHLERQKGGIGLRGPGETQLETDRRLLRNRIMQILSRLEKSRNSASRRRSRAKADIPTVSLVGYTNAGKSTLFNQITAAEVYAANQLFATRTRRCAALTSLTSAKRCWPIPSALFAICRTIW